jgi:NADH-quinone oxidoreductase subunit C
MLTFNELLPIIQKQCTHGDAVADPSSTPTAVKISPLDLVNVCRFLFQDTSTYFDMLSCVTAVDNGVEANTMEVIYNLYSIPFNHHLTIKVTLPREKPEVDSLVSIWKTADWHEREAFDMYGIRFKGHPDLRRILMPADWEGYPLRKDYKHQETYRDIKIEY